jgi:hypothetical protein
MGSFLIFFQFSTFFEFFSDFLAFGVIQKTWKTERKSEKNPLEFEFISVVKHVFIN